MGEPEVFEEDVIGAPVEPEPAKAKKGGRKAKAPEAEAPPPPPAAPGRVRPHQRAAGTGLKRFKVRIDGPEPRQADRYYLAAGAAEAEALAAAECLRENNRKKLPEESAFVTRELRD